MGLGDAEDEEEEEMDRSTLGWKDHSFAFSDFETVRSLYSSLDVR